VQHGVCDFGVDATTLTTIDTAYAQHTKALGVGLVRLTVETAPDGTMPTSLLRQVLDTYGQEGIEAHLEMTPAFMPTIASVAASDHANMLLNTSGDTFISPYIDKVTLRAEGVARQVRRSGAKVVIFWNEANELLLTPGQVVPAGGKGGALSPLCAASLFWHGASRMQSVGCSVFNGALSVLPQTGTNAANPYYAHWLSSFYEDLAAHGKHAPFPWDGWAVNMEGVWSAQSFTLALHVLRGVMTTHGDTGSIRLTEWGWGAGPAVAQADLDKTWAAINASEVESATFFQGPGQVPYTGFPELYKGKGAWMWTAKGRHYQAGSDYTWGKMLRPKYASLAPSLV
jgi:hypothetical protein